MEVLVVVQSYLAERATVGQTKVAVELSIAKAELEVTCRKAVSMEFELASEQKKADEAQKACTTSKERLEKALLNNEKLRDLVLKDKGEADARMVELEKALVVQKALEEESEKSADMARTLQVERAAYPDMYVAVVEQCKQTPEFQMAINAAVAISLAKGGKGKLGLRTWRQS
ncbi:hypothetical protein CsSME_00022248 [Camellia sinensis var. sinensis]